MTTEPSSLLSLEEARQALEGGAGAGVKIAIIDSGVELSHADLQGLQLSDDIALTSDGMRVSVEPGEGRDVYGHGTAIAGIIRAVAPAAEMGSFRVLNQTLGGRTAIIREGVREAIGRGYQVLSCSFGCRGEAQYIMQYKEWVDEAYLNGIHIVSACNNFDVSIPEWPAHFSTVITVNMARAEGLAFYYSQGSLVEFAAAGDRIDVAWMGGGRKTVTGSSYAAPVVSGLLARLLSEYPALPPLEAKAILHRLAKPFRDEIAGENVLRRAT